MRPLTKTEFARERGVSRARVYQWLDDGRISVIGVGEYEGKIDADEAHQRLGEMLDQAKGARRAGNITSSAPGAMQARFATNDAAGLDASPQSGAHASDPEQKQSDDTARVVHPPGNGAAAGKGDRESGAYWSHKTESEKYDSLQKKTRFLQTAGALTVADEVRKERMETARAVRSALVAMVDRVAPVLDAANPARAHKLLMSEVQKALNELRDDLDERARRAEALPGEPTASVQ